MPTYSINESLESSEITVERNKTAHNVIYSIEVDTAVSDFAVSEWLRTTSPLAYTIGTTTHADNTAAILQNVKVNKDSPDKRSFKAAYYYETPTLSGSLPSNPLSRPVDIQWGRDRETIDVFRDYQSTPADIVSSNGQQFASQPTRDRGLLTLTYTKNETVAFFRTTVLPLMAFDTIVNSASFTVDGVPIPALYARLDIESAPKQTENGVTYYRVTYSFTFRAGISGHASDGWRERYLATGTWYWDGTKIVPIRDKDGNPVQDPYPLDSSGNPKSAPTDQADLVGPFSLYPEVSFSSLSFA